MTSPYYHNHVTPRPFCAKSWQLKNSFSYVIWRTLKNAPPLNNILRDSIQFISDQQRVQLPEDLDDQIALLIECMNRHRCLLVLDNVEAVLQSGTSAGEYQKGYEGYGQFFRRLGESHHQSCLLLTSREKLKEIALLEGTTLPVRSRELKGLRFNDGQEILRDKGLAGTKHSWESLVDRYAGNPLALKLVSQFILEVFNGSIDEFLKKGDVIFDDISDVLDQQFERLSSLEQEIMYWLAIVREAITLDEIYNDSIQGFSKRQLLVAYRSLRRRYLIEVTNDDTLTLCICYSQREPDDSLLTTEKGARR